MYFLLFTIILVVIYQLDLSNIDKLHNGGIRFLSSLSPSYTHGLSLYNSLILHTANSSELIHYKFYDELIYEIDQCSKKFGTPKATPILTVKKALIKDIEYEKKVSKLSVSSYFTFLTAALITWLFSYYANFALGSKLSLNFVVLGLTWQLLGFFLFFLILRLFKSKLAQKFDKVFKSIYLLSLFNDIGMPLDTILKSSKMEVLYDAKIKGFQTYQERLSSLVQAKQKNGESIKEELHQLIDEIWMLYAQHCQALEKKVILIKFIWLCTFFFSIYLISVFNILGNLKI